MVDVVIIEDYELVRANIIEVVNSVPGYQVVGDFESYEEALPNLIDLDPAIIFTDITLPGINGIEGTKKVKQLLPKTSIIIISVHEQSKYVFDALCAGAIGYMTKTSSKEKIIEALEQIANGGAPMSGNIARMVVESFQKKQYEELTAKENEVLEFLSKGSSYASIAESLCVSVNTVKTHVKNIYEKLQISSKKELINRSLKP